MISTVFFGNVKNEKGKVWLTRWNNYIQSCTKCLIHIQVHTGSDSKVHKIDIEKIERFEYEYCHSTCAARPRSLVVSQL